ncbi:relaxase MobL [Caproiciproducens sp. CPB-2]|nr:relaxase MobL [Caproiciproducens sp. CPB-2]
MSRKSKIAIAEKERTTREYTAGNLPREEAARWVGVVPDVITDWTWIYYRREGAYSLQEEIASIWTHVISLRREDADALGYDHQKPWRDLVLQKIDVIAKASNIPVSDLHWYAGMHNTTHYPHIHLFVFTDNPKVGHLNVSGINKMKGGIFMSIRRRSGTT